MESDHLDPEYAYLWLSSDAVQSHLRRRARQTTNIANLPPRDVLSTTILVPPLCEQRRIVEVLDEARDIRRLRQQADDLTSQLIPAVFNEMFGGTHGLLQLPEVSIRKVVESADYGTSKAANDNAIDIPVLRMNNVTYDGELDLSDIKHVELPEIELRKQLLRENDVLFNRTNSFELFGKTALWDGRFEAVAASYFVRVRLKMELVDPRYFVAFLILASTKRRLQNMAKQAIGMSNINATELQQIRMPLPDLSLQRQFGDRVVAIRDLNLSATHSALGEKRLTQSLLAHAFSGELTADWREAHREQLAQEAAERDQWLCGNNVKLAATERRPPSAPDRAAGLAGELNSDQKALLEQIRKLDRQENGGLFTPSSFGRTAPLDRLPLDAVRRHLDVLAARGLIKAVSRRAEEGASAPFGNAYRLPQREESESPSAGARLPELDRLAQVGRVIHVSVSDRLGLGDAVDVDGETNEGDD